jgi:hypothetical protein
MRVNRTQSHTDRDVRTNTSHPKPFSDAGNEQLNNISHENLKTYSKFMSPHNTLILPPDLKMELSLLLIVLLRSNGNYLCIRDISKLSERR